MPHWTQYESSEALRLALVANAREYLNVRYRHQGRGREHGLDCLGLLVANARDFGFDFEMDGDADDSYSLLPDSDYFVGRLRAEMVELGTWRAALPGDVVLTRWAPNNPPQHLGIVSEIADDDLECVHASRLARRVVCNRWPDLDLVTHGFRVREIHELMRKEGKVNG